MRANEFIKKFGWDGATNAMKNAIKMEGENIERFKFLSCIVVVSDLKRYVDAYELVQSYGGIDDAKENYKGRPFGEDWNNLKQAITLVEECQ